VNVDALIPLYPLHWELDDQRELLSKLKGSLSVQACIPLLGEVVVVKASLRPDRTSSYARSPVTKGSQDICHKRSYDNPSALHAWNATHIICRGRASERAGHSRLLPNLHPSIFANLYHWNSCTDPFNANSSRFATSILGQDFLSNARVLSH
jgi:hypothetical protein